MKTKGGYEIINFEIFESTRYRLYIGKICNQLSQYHNHVLIWEGRTGTVVNFNNNKALNLDINTIDSNLLNTQPKTIPWKHKRI